ncbi:uncharacterized protein LOC126924598 [Bombus affinis]|uniref:uncharacterized protein LOC126924598 n=1 Tax=Bombus affinis TaxID=309941 RepID=UPI0021B78CB3|nr:uncharacterized protein LOC126924598 [Bombus affinis]
MSFIDFNRLMRKIHSGAKPDVSRCKLPRISRRGCRVPIKKSSAWLLYRSRVHFRRTLNLEDQKRAARSFRIALVALNAIPTDDMHRKIRLEFLVFSVILLLCLILNSGAEAQLNFSTGWGKRSQRLEWNAVRPECPSQARPSFEQLLNVYHLIQMEARKMLECRKPNE